MPDLAVVVVVVVVERLLRSTTTSTRRPDPQTWASQEAFLLGWANRNAKQ
jgi:hypothetical protein